MFLLAPLNPAVIDSQYNSFSFLAVRLFTFIIIFFFILGVAYITTKFISNKSISIINNKNLKVIERISLGMDKTLLLVSFGTYYYVIACSKNSIELIDKHESSQILLKGNDQSGLSKEGFNHYLNKFFSKMESEESDKTLDFTNVSLLNKLSEFKRKNKQMNELLKEELDKGKNQ